MMKPLVAVWLLLGLSSVVGYTQPTKMKSSGKQQTTAGKQLGGQDAVTAITDQFLTDLNGIADGFFHKGEYNHAVNAFRVIIVGDPTSVDTYANAGYLLWSMNKDAEAVQLYEIGLKSNPNSYYMYDELAYYYYNRKKDFQKALGYYEKACTFPDASPATIHLLAHSYERTNQLEKALKVWERASGLPNNPVAKRNLERVRALIAKRNGGK